MSIALIIVAFVAGVLTVAAPCILPLLPIIVGGTVVQSDQKRWYGPLIITASLAVSIVLFTLLLKATTTFLGIPQIVWQVVSASIVLLFGITLLLPSLWSNISARLGLERQSNKWLAESGKQRGITRDILLGAALGPVFASCSPTYALIVAVILPTSLYAGIIYLLSYALGLSAVLLLVGLLGQSLVTRLGWLSNPNGWFKKVLGIIFLLVGLMVLFGIDKQLQAYILQQGWYNSIQNLENSIQARLQ